MNKDKGDEMGLLQIKPEVEENKSMIWLMEKGRSHDLTDASDFV
jgi:hypothetical protein